MTNKTIKYDFEGSGAGLHKDPKSGWSKQTIQVPEGQYFCHGSGGFSQDGLPNSRVLLPQNAAIFGINPFNSRYLVVDRNGGKLGSGKMIFSALTNLVSNLLNGHLLKILVGNLWSCRASHEGTATVPPGFS